MYYPTRTHQWHRSSSLLTVPSSLQSSSNPHCMLTAILLTIVLSPSPALETLKQQLSAGAAAAAPRAEMAALVRELEQQNPTPRPARSPLLDGQWDQVWTDNERAGVKRATGAWSSRRLLGPITGRITIGSGGGVHTQRVARGPLRAELRARYELLDDKEWDVTFEQLVFGLSGVPLLKKKVQGGGGRWRHTFVDEDTRVMRVSNRRGGPDSTYVLRARHTCMARLRSDRDTE